MILFEDDARLLVPTCSEIPRILVGAPNILLRSGARVDSPAGDENFSIGSEGNSAPEVGGLKREMNTNGGQLQSPTSLPKTSKECRKRVLAFLGTSDIDRAISRNSRGLECSLSSFLLSRCLPPTPFSTQRVKIRLNDAYLRLGACQGFTLPPFF